MDFHRDAIYSPRYLLRRHLVLHLLQRYEPGRFLEVGCGSGELMTRLLKRGFEGVGLEISPEVLPLAQETIHPYTPRLQVFGTADEIRGEPFQYVFAFEVLEHIENDADALHTWREWLEPGGRLVLSVPAHMKKWTVTDEAVGHYRRYERDKLGQLLGTCGYTVEIFWSYGFPLVLLTSPLRPIFYRSRLHRAQTMTRQKRTLQSSLESIWTFKHSAWLFRRLTESGCFGFHLLQLLFRRFDLGDGYLVSCRLSS